ncbi:RNI-like protein [Gigaspora margarita]|uniref:RNI-like protein n=1 Tax=Gigaspora margarita TaxID=4874 RepID=A0A8H4AL59_GIGMA|nr:RNI-like protein [Gigaspora margarita]
MLSDALLKNNTLISLNNQLGPEGGKALADSFKQNNILTSLNLCRQTISICFCENRTLISSLNLRKNQLEPEGRKALVNAFKQNFTLTSLNQDFEGGKQFCKNSILAFLSFVGIK